MRIFCTSDIHIDFSENRDWLTQLSTFDFQHDTLILAGDISDKEQHLAWAFRELSARFKYVIFVPGNHDLWVNNTRWHNSLDKYHDLLNMAEDFGIHTRLLELEGVSFVPLQSWYDFTFAMDNDDYLSQRWVDFKRCQWGARFSHADNHEQQAQLVCDYFLQKNCLAVSNTENTVISLSHFVPRIDLMPSYIPLEHQKIYPVLGSHKIDKQIRTLKADCHIYGHSHVNRDVVIDGIRYINNAFAYPTESRISRKTLFEVELKDA